MQTKIPTELVSALQTTLRGFDTGFWQRNISGDSQGGWIVRTLPFMQALGVLQRYVQENVQRLETESSGREGK